MRSARAGPSAQVGWRQVKVLPAFSKAAGCRAEPYGLPGVRGVLVPGGHRSGPTEAAAETSPCLPLLPKKGGRMSPSWGATGTALGAIACGACAPFAASLPPAAPVKAVELCSTPRKFFEKNLTKNFYLSLLFPSAGFWASVSQPAPAPLSAVRDSSRAATR